MNKPHTHLCVCVWEYWKGSLRLIEQTNADVGRLAGTCRGYIWWMGFTRTKDRGWHGCGTWIYLQQQKNQLNLSSERVWACVVRPRVKSGFKVIVKVILNLNFLPFGEVRRRWGCFGFNWTQAKHDGGEVRWMELKTVMVKMTRWRWGVIVSNIRIAQFTLKNQPGAKGQCQVMVGDLIKYPGLLKERWIISVWSTSA